MSKEIERMEEITHGISLAGRHLMEMIAEIANDPRYDPEVPEWVHTKLLKAVEDALSICEEFEL